MRPSDDAQVPDTVGPAPTDLPARVGGEALLRSGPSTRWQGATVALLSGAILFGACQGDNLWSGNSESMQPRIVGIATPSEVYPGDTISIQVSAYATRQVERIEIALSGAVSMDTSTTLSAPAVSVAQTFKIALPTYLADTTLIIRALAYDKVGAVSRQRSDTATAIAPPIVISFSGPDSLRPGVPLRIGMRAVGVRPVSKIRVQLRGAVSRYDSIQIPLPRRDVSDTITFPIAIEDVVDTTLAVDMQAVDNSGLGGYIVRTVLPVSIPVPVVLSVASKDTVAAGTKLDVTVHARGLRTISRLRYSLRGAVSQDQTIPVSLPSKDITETASFTIPANVTESSLTLTVTAIDVANFQSAGVQRTVTIPVGAPVVDELLIPDSIRPASTFDARVIAHGSRPLTRIDLALRGAFEKDVFQPVANLMSVTSDFAFVLPDSSRDSLLVVKAKATDAAGGVSAWFERVIRVSDTAPPTVTASLVAATVAAGRPVGVKITARDNVGLSWVGARLYTVTDSLIGSDSIVASGRLKDATVSLMTPIGPARTLKVVAFARDRSNRVGNSNPMQLAVVDSSLPLVQITRPFPDQTVPLADPLTVTVQASSLVGVKQIDLSGVAIRGDSLTNPTVVTRYNATSVTFPPPGSGLMPHDTTITRLLTARSDTVSEYVRVIALVTDSSGKRSADTVRIAVGGPLVQILTPTASGGNVGVGTPFLLRVLAKDRSAGVDSITALITGALNDSVKWGGLGAVDSVVQQADVTIPVAGTVTINVTAWNHRQIAGRASPVNVTAATGGASDQMRPSIAISSVTAPVRVELNQPIQVAVRAQDNGTAGLVRFGIVATLARPAGFSGTRIDTVALATPTMTARSGWIDTVFTFTPAQFGLTERNLVLPASLSLRVSGFAVDAGNYCGAGATVTADSIACQAVAISTAPPGAFYVPATGAATTSASTLVIGYSRGLPDGGNIADAAVDNPHGQLYLSNIGANKVDVLKLTDSTFVATGGSSGIGLVGSQPWGLFLNGAGDTLFVANSGSTNISFLVVDGGPDNLKEHVSRRLLTPNEVLYEIRTAVSNGLIRYTGTFYDFSDRPQYVAQDMHGRLVYSTKPTLSAADGTLRYVIPKTGPGEILEPKLLYNEKAITPTNDVLAIAYVDSIKIRGGGSVDDSVRIWDHVPGQPWNVISSGLTTLAGAVAYLETHGSDIRYYAGKWNLPGIGMSDTTFMAASGDRGKIAFGEGAVSPAGRILVWDGTVMPVDSASISNQVAVADLVNNASERVFGLGFNKDGSLGVARGEAGAYFFTPDLRLQGLFSTPGGAGGAAMHPEHVDPRNSTNGLSFVSTPNKTIKILDAVHFFQRGEITLRDNVTGPVKAALPLPSENLGLAPGDPNYILVKLYGVTGYTDATGNHTQVVILNVREKDLTN